MSMTGLDIKKGITMDKLQNCPNCGGFLDDFGRCEFCGSKVYDLCDIDVRTTSGKSGSASYIKRGKTYIRILTDNRLIIAPVMTNTVNITCSRDSFPTMDIEFMVCGDMTMREVEEE